MRLSAKKFGVLRVWSALEYLEFIVLRLSERNVVESRNPLYYPVPIEKGSLSNNLIDFRRPLHFGRGDGRDRDSFGFSKISISVLFGF